EGGTPASFSRSLMKRRSSYCLRVSISSCPPGCRYRSIPRRRGERLLLETNHERTLYVRYVFRNILISGERDRLGKQPWETRAFLDRKAQDIAGRAARGRGREWRAYHECLCRSEIPKQRTVLVIDRRCNQRAVCPLGESCTKIIFALIVGDDFAA